jgi:hypothetical protein
MTLTGRSANAVPLGLDVFMMVRSDIISNNGLKPSTLNRWRYEQRLAAIGSAG